MTDLAKIAKLLISALPKGDPKRQPLEDAVKQKDAAAMKGLIANLLDEYVKQQPAGWALTGNKDWIVDVRNALNLPDPTQRLKDIKTKNIKVPKDFASVINQPLPAQPVAAPSAGQPKFQGTPAQPFGASAGFPPAYYAQGAGSPKLPAQPVAGPSAGIPVQNIGRPPAFNPRGAGFPPPAQPVASPSAPVFPQGAPVQYPNAVRLPQGAGGGFPSPAQPVAGPSAGLPQFQGIPAQPFGTPAGFPPAYYAQGAGSPKLPAQPVAGPSAGIPVQNIGRPPAFNPRGAGFPPPAQPVAGPSAGLPQFQGIPAQPFGAPAGFPPAYYAQGAGSPKLPAQPVAPQPGAHGQSYQSVTAYFLGNLCDRIAVAAQGNAEIISIITDIRAVIKGGDIGHMQKIIRGIAGSVDPTGHNPDDSDSVWASDVCRICSPSANTDLNAQEAQNRLGEMSPSAVSAIIAEISHSLDYSRVHGSAYGRAFARTELGVTQPQQPSAAPAQPVAAPSAGQPGAWQQRMQQPQGNNPGRGGGNGIG